MATIKSYTDVNQSRKLCEILPLESADMCYRIVSYNPNNTHVYKPYCFVGTLESDIPCWSLAALLNVLPDSIYDNTNEFSQLEFSKRSVAYHDMNDGIKVGSIQDNLVDACYEMILKLHELNLLDTISKI